MKKMGCRYCGHEVEVPDNAYSVIHSGCLRREKCFTIVGTWALVTAAAAAVTLVVWSPIFVLYFWG